MSEDTAALVETVRRVWGNDALFWAPGVRREFWQEADAALDTLAQRLADSAAERERTYIAYRESQEVRRRLEARVRDTEAENNRLAMALADAETKYERQRAYDYPAQVSDLMGMLREAEARAERAEAALVTVRKAFESLGAALAATPTEEPEPGSPEYEAQTDAFMDAVVPGWREDLRSTEEPEHPTDEQFEGFPGSEKRRIRRP